ncbi:MAG TPA: NAD(P)-dependent oxidoreductase [Cyclobacteriaceae bacterium]|nr:NAD(P)-dependent oxidoreductase [Cyclobacteriaceae bacterium]
MRTIKLGIIREGKIPVDKRVPFTPAQVSEIIYKFPHVEIFCQHSSIRSFSDLEYEQTGIKVVHDLSHCDLLMGIKEVPLNNLIDHKTYLFFSHTMKKQPHNRRLLQAILKKNITLIDYEALTDAEGNRLVAFGRYAGIVGTYNCFWMIGKRYKNYSLRRAMDCIDYNDLKRELPKIKLPSQLRIVLTGSGRVGKGAEQILSDVGVRKVNPDDFLNHSFDEPVYVQLRSRDYHVDKSGREFSSEEFHSAPEKFDSDFLKYAQVADVLINGAYWNPGAPRLFSREEMLDPSFKIKIIADISCDIDGSVPATIKATDVNDPVYDYNPFSHTAEPPFSNEKFISIMAVDNLPCELPRSASEDFGRGLIDRVLPSLIVEDNKGVIMRATIAKGGKLTARFAYLSDYITGH